ncbi:hypothetical protein LPJ57_003229 [Coemansia sp. RSA 486]|nr:hypothetical protein LPJ57_003229 [Coemansia sp. RSA 486]KAJ2236725.1 hypothetical protein IWW45_001541 [Coemansia sp. RSA 485]
MEPRLLQEDPPVHVIFRYPFKRPASFVEPTVTSSITYTLEEKVWRFLRALPGPDQPGDILAELEQDQVTFDWELLATTLQEPLARVFEAASNLFNRHMGRPLVLLADSSSLGGAGLQTNYVRAAVVGSSELTDGEGAEVAGSRDFERAGLRSVESLGRSQESGSPVVGLSMVTPRDEKTEGSLLLAEQSPDGVEEDDAMRQSLIAEAMAERVQQHVVGVRSGAPLATIRESPATATERPEAGSSSRSSSFSDLSSNNSLTESAMQDAMLAETMNGSTVMSSILGSRMFPWTKRRR